MSVPVGPSGQARMASEISTATPAHADEIAEDDGPKQHEEERRGGSRALVEGPANIVPAVALGHQHQERDDGAGPGRLGHGEDADIDAADDGEEQREYAPGPVGGVQSFSPGEPGHPLPCRLGLDARIDVDADHIYCGGDDAGYETGDEQLDDRELSQQSVEDQHAARRNQHAERARRRNGSGGERIGDAVALHFRNADAAHRQRGDDAGSGACPEHGAGAHRRERHAAAQMAEAPLGELESAPGKTRPENAGAREDEQRKDDEPVSGRLVEEHPGYDSKRHVPPQQQGIAREADEHHGEADGHPDHQQGQQDDKEADDQDGFQYLTPGHRGTSPEQRPTVGCRLPGRAPAPLHGGFIFVRFRLDRRGSEQLENSPRELQEEDEGEICAAEREEGLGRIERKLRETRLVFEDRP